MALEYLPFDLSGLDIIGSTAVLDTYHSNDWKTSLKLLFRVKKEPVTFCSYDN